MKNQVDDPPDAQPAQSENEKNAGSNLARVEPVHFPAGQEEEQQKQRQNSFSLVVFCRVGCDAPFLRAANGDVNWNGGSFFQGSLDVPDQ